MTNRKIQIGLFFTYGLILIHVLNALTYYGNVSLENDNIIKDILYQVVYTYCYVSILILIKKLILEDDIIERCLKRIILIEVLKTITGILFHLGISMLGILETIFSIASLVLFIILAINVFKGKHTNTLAISGLRPFILSQIILFAIATPFLFYTVYTMNSDNSGLAFGVFMLLTAISYFFLIGYFKKFKNNSRTELFDSNTTNEAEQLE